jgi:GTP-binding protein HflX
LPSAQSSEGKLQVELAQLEHLATRLVRGWTHLERQKGGIGLRGPGETQLETDRRLLGIRVQVCSRSGWPELERQRGVQRKARGRGELLNVSLVGYTNAGKSTLFNALTHAGVFAADQLFATLDTTTRKLWLPEAGHIVLSDTVGFIRNLPHSLVAAFHATLEATAEADLLLHVVDSASPARDDQVADVNKVLAEIGAADVPQLTVLNKLDLTGLPPAVERDEYGRILRVRVSARSAAGLTAAARRVGRDCAGEDDRCARTCPSRLLRRMPTGCLTPKVHHDFKLGVLMSLNDPQWGNRGSDEWRWQASRSGAAGP